VSSVAPYATAPLCGRGSGVVTVAVCNGVWRSFSSWVLLGQVADMDAFVETNVTTVADWDANFKMLKLRRRESEKLPDFQKVDCITVSFAPFKAAVEDQMQVPTRCGDAPLYHPRLHPCRRRARMCR
jgi:hypothetical protein